MQRIPKERFIEDMEVDTTKFVAIPCDCDYEECYGWIMVPKRHKEGDKRGLNEEFRKLVD